MRVIVNERSFVGQATVHTADNLVRQLLGVIEMLTPILCGHPVFRHSTLKAKPLVGPETPLVQWINNHPDKDFQRRLLLNLTKGPYVEVQLESIEHLCEYGSEDVTGSSIAYAAHLCATHFAKDYVAHDPVVQAPHLAAALISLEGCPAFARDSVIVQFCLDSDAELESILVRNLIQIEQAESIRPRYVTNPKHDDHHLGRGQSPVTSREPVRGQATPMDLDKDTAQLLLNCGEGRPDGKQIYGRHVTETGVERFYTFQPDNAGGYHGFPVPASDVPSSVVERLRSRASE